MDQIAGVIYIFTKCWIKLYLPYNCKWFILFRTKSIFYNSPREAQGEGLIGNNQKKLHNTMPMEVRIVKTRKSKDWWKNLKRL